MNVVKKIWNVVSTVLVALIVLCAVFLMGSRLIGYQCYTVISGSMQPTYEVGDLLYVKKVDVNTIKEGDPITFVLNEDLVVATHRVVKVDAANQRFYTKGDANDIPDGDPVHFKNVIGVPQFSIPWLGYVSDFVQNPPGMYITIAVGAVLLILVFLPDLVKKKKTEVVPEGESTASLEVEAARDENKKLKEELDALKEQLAKQKSAEEK